MALSRFFKSAKPEQNLSFGGPAIPKEIIGEIIKRLLSSGDLKDLQSLVLVDKQFSAFFNSIFSDTRRYPRLANQLALYKRMSSYQKYSHVAIIPTKWIRGKIQEAANRNIDQATLTTVFFLFPLVIAFLGFLFADPTLHQDSSSLEIFLEAALLVPSTLGYFLRTLTLPAIILCCVGITMAIIELTDIEVTAKTQQSKQDLITELRATSFAPN
jgi:hypothetical protein